MGLSSSFRLFRQPRTGYPVSGELPGIKPNCLSSFFRGRLFPALSVAVLLFVMGTHMRPAVED